VSLDLCITKTKTETAWNEGQSFIIILTFKDPGPIFSTFVYNVLYLLWMLPWLNQNKVQISNEVRPYCSSKKQCFFFCNARVNIVTLKIKRSLNFRIIVKMDQLAINVSSQVIWHLTTGWRSLGISREGTCLGRK